MPRFAASDLGLHCLPMTLGLYGLIFSNLLYGPYSQIEAQIHFFILDACMQIIGTLANGEDPDNLDLSALFANIKTNLHCRNAS